MNESIKMLKTLLIGTVENTTSAIGIKVEAPR